MTKFRKILAPTDFSENAQAGVRMARELAVENEAELLLAHVSHDPLYPFASSSTVQPELEKELKTAVAKQLARQAEELEGEGVRVRSLFLHGQPFLEIADIAKEEGVDLIVMATHGYTGVQHLLMGSTTERVLRVAPCPVLVVPRRKA